MPPSTDEHQLQLPSANPEWARRLKGADSSVIHRSVDCIPNKVIQIEKISAHFLINLQLF